MNKNTQFAILGNSVAQLLWFLVQAKPHGHTSPRHDAQDRLNVFEVVQVGVEEQAEDLGVILGAEGGGQLTQPAHEFPVLHPQLVSCDAHEQVGLDKLGGI